MTYNEMDKMLFSGDAFGSFNILDSTLTDFSVSPEITVFPGGYFFIPVILRFIRHNRTVHRELFSSRNSSRNILITHRYPRNCIISRHIIDSEENDGMFKINPEPMIYWCKAQYIPNIFGIP